MSPQPQPRLDQWTDFPEILTFPVNSEAQNEAMRQINREGCQFFIDAHPEHPANEYTGLKLAQWCHERKVPATRRNLELAARDLDLGTLTPVETEPELIARPTPTFMVHAAQTSPPTPQERKRLAAVSDDVSLNDHQRKNRDRKLRNMSNAQHRLMSTHA